MQCKRYVVRGQSFYIHRPDPGDHHRLYCMRQIYEKKKQVEDGKYTLKELEKMKKCL